MEKSRPKERPPEVREKLRAIWVLEFLDTFQWVKYKDPSVYEPRAPKKICWLFMLIMDDTRCNDIETTVKGNKLMFSLVPDFFNDPKNPTRQWLAHTPAI